jgi:hypothetical protein
VRRALRDNSLGIVFGLLFLAALAGQAAVGHADFNDEQLDHDGSPISFWRYVTSSAFVVDVTENWQSEYLQFTLFIFLTVWLVQRGSPESKKVDEAGAGEDPVPDRTWRTKLYSNSLVLVMGTIFLASWAAQAVAGRVLYNADQLDHHEAPLTLLQYVASADFWNRTLQNWQSEFLAVGSMAVFAIYLRQRGSPESKPVMAADEATSVEG